MSPTSYQLLHAESVQIEMEGSASSDRCRPPQLWAFGPARVRPRKPGGRRFPRRLSPPRGGRFPFSIIFQLRRSENRKNAAIPAFFELNCKLPKLRTWVRFPSPAPENKALRPLPHFPSFPNPRKTVLFFEKCRSRVSGRIS